MTINTAEVQVKPLSELSKLNALSKLKCRRCRYVFEKQDQIPVKKDRYGMTTMGCPNCRASVFTLVKEESHE